MIDTAEEQLKIERQRILATDINDSRILYAPTSTEALQQLAPLLVLSNFGVLHLNCHSLFHGNVAAIDLLDDVKRRALFTNMAHFGVHFETAHVEFLIFEEYRAIWEPAKRDIVSDAIAEAMLTTKH